MIRSFKCNIFSIMALLAGIGPVYVNAQEEFHRFTFEGNGKPSWVISGVWSLADPNSILLVDIGGDRVVTYELFKDRAYAVAELEGIPGIKEKYFPSVIQSDGGNYLLENKDGHMIWLDHDLNFLSDFYLTPQKANNALVNVKNTRGDVLLSAFNWILGGELNLIVFGDVKKQENISAFVEIGLKYGQQPTVFKTLKEIGVKDSERDFFLLGQQYLAVFNERAAFLMMHPEPTLYIENESLEGEPGKRRIEARAFCPEMLGSMGVRPALSLSSGAEGARRIFEDIKVSSFPFGLYSWKNSLYVLSKQRLGSDNFWRLIKLNLNGDCVGGSVTSLPTSADYLVAIPGIDKWAFIEKGDVKDLGEQEIDSILIVEASMFAVDGN